MEVHRAYQRIGTLAARYDGMMTASTVVGRLALRLFGGFDEQTYPKYKKLAFAGIPADFSGRLLEIPVGTGALSLPIYCSLPQAEIVCMDYSQNMLQIAEDRAISMGLSNLRFNHGDVSNLLDMDESYDAVLSINGLHAFPNKISALRETQRVLKAGGIFTGCAYIKGENKLTDLFVRTFCSHRGYFTPPFDTKYSFEKRLRTLYRDVKLETVGSFVCFRCKK
ncbi:class I SAM-dependent methyltransferase [Selenomonas ruminantium]|uniref:Methyltransferase domain-containing protein n=1 Tax=Selenomonas ruminantium TaxID=971 RepID=A0A1H3VTZ9_SELRU|nr:class I SAM-dependent methyltransferase [Selenomonas ruminantium]SDZ77592.1 Methyltransferase domain-containing protein [Selenomonas ruminantium]